MKILVTGANGQLGHDICRELEAQPTAEYVGVDIGDFDITNQQQVREYLLRYRPEVIIHCSAYTAVDRAEDESELCAKINVNGTRNIALVCKEIGAKMLYISTDYVFSGEGAGFYEVDAETEPMSIYGLTKLKGEQEVTSILTNYFIIRTSWVFGIHGNNFVNAMLRVSAVQNEIKVVCDQVGSPTYTVDLARFLCDVIMTDKYGVYHVTNEGVCSWAEFAECIFQYANLDVHVQHIAAVQFSAKAKRPYNSRLSKDRLVEAGFSRLPDWKDALIRYLKEAQCDGHTRVL